MASDFPNEPQGTPTPTSPTPPPPPPITPAPGMVGRIQRLVTNPTAEWRAIDGEPTAAKPLFMSWAVPLAAIGPVATLLGFVLLVGGFMFQFALVYVVVAYALVLVSTWVLAMAVDGLAPNFGSTKNFDQAMKAVCYAMTPFWVAGVLAIVPDLTPLAMLAGLYGVYLLWIGLPVVMKTPADKAPGYVAVTALIAVVLIFVSYKIAGSIAASVFRASVMSGFPGLN